MKSTGLVFKSRDYIGSAEPPATVLEDESRFGHNSDAFASGHPNWVRLPSGLWVLSFVTDDYVEIGDTSAFKWMHGAENPTGFKFTIGLWMALPTPEPDAAYGLVCTCINSSSDEGIYLAYDDREPGNDRQLRLMIFNGALGEAICTGLADNLSSPNDSNWHFITVTYDQALANTNALFYIDAVPIGTITQDKSAYTPSSGNSDDELHIGSSGGEGDFLTGSIAHPFIKNYVLSAGKVKQIFEGERHWFGV